MWVLRDTSSASGGIFLHELLLGWTPDACGATPSLADATKAAGLARMEDETAEALLSRVREMVRCSTFALAGAAPREAPPAKELDDVLPQVAPQARSMAQRAAQT